jgi:pyruvate dehydrogenase E1 component alpha subunit
MDSVAARFEIVHRRHLAPDGTACGPWPAFARDPAALAAMYRAMVRTRAFDQKAVALQRTGRLGTFASSLGQEAVGVGIGMAMQAEDVLVPSFREQGTQLLRGVTMRELLLYWGGDERGSAFAGPREDFPICVPVGSQAPHAAGIALAMRLRGEARAVVCVMGDGATSKGDVAEAIDFAGVWSLPLVFVVDNNQWAISVPRRAQTAAETLAQKAIAGGIAALQVDGNDVIAVRDAMEEALARARSGGGATLIEAVTYRLADHTTSDDARRYRDDAEVSAHWHEEPVARLRTWLTAAGAWSKAEEDALLATCREEVQQAEADYLATPPQDLASVFDHTYAALPAELARQKAEAVP